MIPLVDVNDTAYHRAALKISRTNIIIQPFAMQRKPNFRATGVKMHGNKKLCSLLLGKCIGAGIQNLTTKNPPNLAMREVFV